MRSSSSASVVVVGLGGLGCPAAACLARAGVARLTLVDDDRVDETNLHRQILYSAEDVGQDKVTVAARALRKIAREAGSRTEVTALRTRLLPDTAQALLAGAELVLEGADNFATKFLAADACWLAGVPVVHGAAIRWLTTAWAVSHEGRPCYRCLFEDVPKQSAESCDGAGVMGPVAGFGGSLLAELALRFLAGQKPFGFVLSFDAQRDRLRHTPVQARGDCPLCGPSARIDDLREERYVHGLEAA